MTCYEICEKIFMLCTKCKIFFHYRHCLYREKFQSLYHFQLGNCVQADWNGTHLGQLAIQAAAAAFLSCADTRQDVVWTIFCKITVQHFL